MTFIVIIFRWMYKTFPLIKCSTHDTRYITINSTLINLHNNLYKYGRIFIYIVIPEIYLESLYTREQICLAFSN